MGFQPSRHLLCLSAAEFQKLRFLRVCRIAEIKILPDKYPPFITLLIKCLRITFALPPDPQNIEIPQLRQIKQPLHHLRAVTVAPCIRVDEIGPPQLKRLSIDLEIHISHHGYSAESDHLFHRIRCPAAARKLQPVYRRFAHCPRPPEFWMRYHEFHSL